MNKPLASVRLADLTAPDFAALAARQPVVLLALGSQEDHGPHQPMGDFVLADEIAERIARAANEAGTLCVRAPTLPFGVAVYFAPSPGGLGAK